MITGLSRRRHLATRAACAAVLVTSFFVLTSVLAPHGAPAPGLGKLGSWGVGVVCAAICLAWPPLFRRREGLPLDSEESTWVVSASGALFSVCALAPPFGLFAPDASGLGSLLLAALVGLSGAIAATRAAWRPGYALLALVAAVSAFLMVVPGQGAGAEPGTASTASSGQDLGRVWPVSIEIEGGGPGQVALEGYPPLVIQSDWLVGERRGVQAWMVGPEEASDWEVFTGGRAGVESGVSGVVPMLASGEFRAPPWAVRGGASLAASGARWPVVGLLIVLVGLVASVAVQRSAQMGPIARAGTHFALAAGAMLLAGLMTSGSDSRSGNGGPGAEDGHPGVTVTEGRRLLDGTTEWVQVQRAFGVLEWSVDGSKERFSGEIVVGGRQGVARTERVLQRQGGAARVVARDAQASIDWRRPFDSGLRLLLPEVNTWGEFEACWERTGGGEWRSLGGWELGLPVPDTMAKTAAGPPGWCASGLSQGTSVFVGRLAASSLEASTRTGEAWVRLVGFRP